MSNTGITISRGRKYPYDAPDDWDGTQPAPVMPGSARDAARCVIADLTDRRGIKCGFEGVDEDIRKEIVESLAATIRTAKDTYQEHDTCQT